MIYEDGTMDVQIGNQIVRRKVKVVRTVDLFNTTGRRFVVDAPAEPFLEEGEQAFYCVGSDIPQIIKVRNAR